MSDNIYKNMMSQVKADDKLINETRVKMSRQGAAEEVHRGFHITRQLVPMMAALLLVVGGAAGLGIWLNFNSNPDPYRPNTEPSAVILTAPITTESPKTLPPATNETAITNTATELSPAITETPTASVTPRVTSGTTTNGTAIANTTTNGTPRTTSPPAQTTTAPPTQSSAVVTTTTPPDNRNDVINFGYQRLRGNWLASMDSGEITIIQSRGELERHVGDEDEWHELTSWGSAMKYDNAFFATQMLAVVYLTEGSSSVTHTVTGVERNGDDLDIHITRTVPMLGSADMASWHIFVELDKVSARGYQAVINNLTSG
jgi:hypothetical protein